MVRRPMTGSCCWFTLGIVIAIPSCNDKICQFHPKLPRVSPKFPTLPLRKPLIPLGITRTIAPRPSQRHAPTWKLWACGVHQRNTIVVAVVVGTLKDGYIRKVPLPRVPRIQSASHMCYTHDTCYSEQVTGIPTWRDLVRSLAGLGRSTLQPFSLLLV